MKTCNTCGETKRLHDFYRDRSYKGGTSASCKVCKRQMNQRRREKDRPIREAVVRWVKERGCCHCGETNPTVLQLHHWPKTRSELGWKDKNYLHPAVGLGEFIRNICACVVICANCHLREHAGEIAIDKSAVITYTEVYEMYKILGGTITIK